MNKRLMMGIDVGTTNIKVAVFTADGGELINKVAARTPWFHPGETRTECRAEELWNRLLGLIDRGLESVRPEDLKAVSVTGVGESGVPLGSSGDPLYNVIYWRDPRSTPQYEEIVDSLGAGKIRKITGLNPDYIFTLNKLKWLQEERPKLFSRLDTWLDIPGWVVYMLTGEKVMDYSEASRTMCLDIWEKEWSEEILAGLGLSARFLPKLDSAGTPIGHPRREIVDRTKLPADVTVTVGAHDHIAAAYGLGITPGEEVLTSMGTTDSLLLVGAADDFRDNLDCENMNVGCHITPGGYYGLLAIGQAGGLLDWLVKDVGEYTVDENSTGRSSDDEVYKKVLKESAALSPGIEKGLLVSPTDGLNGNSTFTGITSEVTVPQLTRSILEGLACESRWKLDSYHGDLWDRANRVVAVGGGAKNELWLKIKACVLDKRISVPRTLDLTTFGAA
ncbi:MAG: FGGY-family carbohydrate kinase, partial [Candidatus Bipolaricaulota bacterium]